MGGGRRVCGRGARCTIASWRAPRTAPRRSGDATRLARAHRRSYPATRARSAGCAPPPPSLPVVRVRIVRLQTRNPVVGAALLVLVLALLAAVVAVGLTLLAALAAVGGAALLGRRVLR